MDADKILRRRLTHRHRCEEPFHTSRFNEVLGEPELREVERVIRKSVWMPPLQPVRRR